jgi:hypothetical protein
MRIYDLLITVFIRYRRALPATVFAAVLIMTAGVCAQNLDSSCGNCPGDINGDGTVNFRDFAIVAANWLNVCEDQLPVYIVTESGLSEDAAAALAENLGISARLTAWENGALIFTDPESFQAVPTTEVTDPQLIAELIKESDDDRQFELTFQAFDFEALREIRPLEPEQALKGLYEALRKAEALPDGGSPEVVHTMFEAFDTKGSPILPAVQLDTRVNYSFNLAGIPLIGPGAQISATFEPKGRVSQLVHSARKLKPAGQVQIIPSEEAAHRCAELYPGLRGQIRPRLMYYAPPLSQRNVQALVPCYDCAGTVRTGSGRLANLLEAVVPATDDRRFVPTVNLQVQVKGGLVMAEASVAGAQPPYAYQWLSSSTVLPDFPDDASKIEYNAAAREPGVYPETVKVIVTDENGVQVQASKTVTVIVDQVLLANEHPIQPLSFGAGRDFGVERAVSDLGGQEQSGYVNRMDDEIFKRFNWTGVNSWERDFKDLETWPTGLDHSYVDNVDQAFYVGHGSGGGITFESNHDDADLWYTDAAGAWGDADLEWMALLSCQVLREQFEGKFWWERWGPTFDGLHLLLGYQTNARAKTDTAKRFAQYQLGRNFVFVTITLPVRAAWCQAKKEEQPNDREAVVMGVIGPNGLSNYNDYFWGKGPVGPDLRGSNIRGYWRIVYK